MNTLRCTSLIAIFILLVFPQGCESMKPQPVFFLSLHQVVANGEIFDGGLVKEIRSPDGREKCHIRSVPLVSSAYLERAEVVPSEKPLKFGLRLYFVPVAQGICQEATIYHKGTRLAVMVDGFLAGFTTMPRRLESDGSIVIDPLWNKYEVKKIVDNVERNYKICNGDW